MSESNQLEPISPILTTRIDYRKAGQHPVAVYLARLGTRTQRTALSALRAITEIASGGQVDPWNFPWPELRYSHVSAIRVKLAESYAPANANRLLAVLCGVLRECWHLGYMTAEEFHLAKEVPPVKGSRLPKGRALRAGELRALFEACAEDSRPAGRRDAAMLAVLYGCGLRRSEAVNLDLADYDSETGSLKIRQGKGNKDRFTYVGNGKQAIEDWLAVRGHEPGPLFPRIGKGDRITLERITDQAVMVILRRRALAAGVAEFSPHDLRRTFVGDLLDTGVDISIVQRLAGHASMQTTGRYDRRGEEEKRKAAFRLHIPYKPMR